MRLAVPQVKGLYRSGQLDKEVNIAQAIEPNDDRAPQIPGLKGRKYRSVIWEWGQSQNLVLELKGYHELPFCAPRWHVIGNDSYGRSPGMDALASSKMLQQMEKRCAQAIDKVVNPPMVAGVEMKNEPASLLPGGVTYVSNMQTNGFKPAYEVPPNIQGIEEKIAKAEARINSAFFADLFLMISQLDDCADRNRNHRAKAGKDADARTFFGAKPVRADKPVHRARVLQ